MRVDIYYLYKEAKAIDAKEADKAAADYVHLRISVWEYADRLNEIIKGRKRV